MSTLKKPHSDAIQTIYGWALSTTGEILVSKKGLPEPVAGFKIGKPWKNEVLAVKIIKPIVPEVVSVVEPEVVEPEVVESVESFEEMVVEVVKPKRVARKRVIKAVDDI